MPVIEYLCTSCGKRYDVLHLTAERQDDIICPFCNSIHYRRLISAPAIMNSHRSMPECSPDTCQNPDGCCGGACALDS